LLFVLSVYRQLKEALLTLLLLDLRLDNPYELLCFFTHRWFSVLKVNKVADVDQPLLIWTKSNQSGSLFHLQLTAVWNMVIADKWAFTLMLMESLVEE
jgi:hypothetical protein